MSAPTADPRDVLLADGHAARIRALTPDDTDRVRAFYETTSDRSRSLRFFAPLPGDVAARTGGAPADDPSHCVVGAEVRGALVGVGQYDVVDDDLAEIAFMIRDDYQRRGLGTILLETLVQRAAARGIRRFRADFLRENGQMADMLANAGYSIRWAHHDGTVGEAEFELVATDRWYDARAHRDRVAQAESIRRLLRPRAIAVIGAGRRDTSIGRAIVTNLVEGGYRGDIYPVNPHPLTIAGRATQPTILDIPGRVDLAVVAVPAENVLEVAHQCAQRGVDGLVVISGGFAELDGGAQVQQELVDVCRHAGIRLVGPNCVGVVNADPEVRMNATFSPVPPSAGRIGFASQSGGVGIELLSRAHALGLGVSTFVSMGNKADVSGNDLMQYWAEDPATDVVLLYLESFGNPRTFARVAKELARRKPIVAMKSGRSLPGARGTRSHTAALADLDAAVDTLLRATGVIRVDTLEELFDVAALVGHQPVPTGRRVAVMSNGGGPAIVAADACVAAGLEVPELSTELQDALREAALPGAGTSNPIDLIAAAGADVFERAMRLVLSSTEIDALLVIYVAPYVTSASDVGAAVARAVVGFDTPVAACFLGVDDAPAVFAAPPSSTGVPNFTYPESAARALAHAAHLGEWRARPPGRLPLLADIDRDGARQRAVAALAVDPPPADGWVAPTVAFGLLRDYDIPTVPTEYATSARGAAAIARTLGFPVALKAVAPGLVHKTDVGGVRLGLTSAHAVERTVREMRETVGPTMDGVVVQPMVRPGLELIVGITHDPNFGPLVLFGAGGTGAELQRDTALAIPPLTDGDVDEMMRSLRISPLLFGYRNTEPVDVAALADFVSRIGRLADDVDEIAELDCNPVIASPDGVTVVDAKLRLRTQTPRRDVFELDEDRRRPT